jgi:hypothetical protein
MQPPEPAPLPSSVSAVSALKVTIADAGAPAPDLFA